MCEPADHLLETLFLLDRLTYSCSFIHGVDISQYCKCYKNYLANIQSLTFTRNQILAFKMDQK